MKKLDNPVSQEEVHAGLMALCEGLENCFAYIGHYQTGSISYISKSVTNILGYSQEYFLKSGVDALRSVVHPDDMPGIVLILSDFTKDCHTNFSSGNPDKSRKVVNYYFRAKHKEGHWVPTDQRVFILSSTEKGLPDLIFSILSASTAYIDAALNKNSLTGEKESLLSYIEAISLPTKNLSNSTNHTPQNSANGVLEITTHLNPVRAISEREKEVLKLISDGLATKEIAEKLSISFHTVESHRKNLLEKFGAKNSAELVKAASKFYWLE